MAQSHAGFFYSMPWTAKDAESKTKKADTAKKREVWAKVANETLKREQGKGNKDAEATAVKEANAAVDRMKEDEQPTHGRLQEFTGGAATPLKVDAEKGITRAELLTFSRRHFPLPFPEGFLT